MNPSRDRELEFENQAFVELLSEDGLLILARGLGLDRLFLKFLKLYSDPHNLVLVLNSTSAQEKYFVEALAGEQVECLPKIINNEYSAKERVELYLKGGVLFVTSRILVMDLLRNHCPVEKVAGILVSNAHRITDSSTASFILTLYREKNKIGFIKAFSDAPEPFIIGFSQLERVMRNLFLRNLYLWPRFHATVSASLSRHKPDVIELRQQMSSTMTAIQMSILDIMKACITELKRYNPCLDTDDVTVENSMGKSFDQIIKMQLDPIWNQLGSKSKQLIYDLRMLRTLLYFLTQYDCVTFYSYLEAVRSSDDRRSFSSNSTWAFMDASNLLFAKAWERVYGTPEKKEGKAERERLSSNTTGHPSHSEEELLLEESPKWHLLSMVLDEIRKESKSNSEVKDAGKILVVANDERTCYQLREFLCVGGYKLLQRQFQRLIASKKQITQREVYGVQFQSSKSTSGEETSSERKKEGLRSRKRKGGTEQKPTGKKKKISSKEEDKEKFTEEGGDDEITNQFLQEVQEAEMMIFQEESKSGHVVMKPAPSKKDAFGVVSGPVVILHSLSSSDNPYHLTKLLGELKPKFIVMYDSEVQYVRQIEVFKASNPGMPLRVYFLLYDSSVEEQKYLTSLRKEKEAFHQLIRERAHMVVPVDREGKVGDCSLLHRDTCSSRSLEPVNTRIAGGRKPANRDDDEPHKVIIDIREFRSTLPFLLHKRGIEIVPLTLEVGDYILTPDICVERKSVSDLIGSLNSGRLFNQATAMTRHYKKPVLLIEFDENKSFSLQSKSSIHSEISSQSVSSKLVLLTLHFPNLQILWCSSPHATSELFEELKQDQPEPDPDVAVVIGQDTLGYIQDNTLNAAAQDFLLKLPGINSKNYRKVMEEVKDLQELVNISEERLESILGNDANARLLWSFLHSELKKTDTKLKNHKKS